MEIINGMYGKIIEMIQDDITPSLNIENDPRINIAELTKDDPTPMFAIIEVIRTGISKVNRRVYSDAIVNSLIEMIPGTIGYLGHPDPSKTHFEFRDPQCIYVGAIAEELINGGGIRAIGKAYIFQNSPLREWIPKSIACGNPLTVSINGTGDVMRDTVNNLLHVQSIDVLESIDWANPGTEGVGTAQAITIVSEMKDNDEKGGKGMEILTKTPELIKSVTLAEMKAYNVEVINSAITGVTIAELQGQNPTLVESIKESGKITEMSMKIDGVDKMVKLTEMQSIIDGKDAKIVEFQNAIAVAKITEYKSKKIAELVPEGYADKVLGRVTGNTEAEIDASVVAEVAYIKEMIGENKFDNIPKGNLPRKDYDTTVGQVKNLFGVKETTK